MNIIIFGVGGGGSNLAYLLSKSKKITSMTLVDHDVVEEKNLARQLYTIDDVGKPKALALQAFLQKCCSIPIYTKVRKIESAIDLSDFDKSSFALICTDNIASKKLIAKNFPLFLAAGNQTLSFEITNDPKRWDNIWETGESGYSSEQTFLANMFAAITMSFMFEYGINKPVKFSNIKKMLGE